MAYTSNIISGWWHREKSCCSMAEISDII